MPSALRSEQMNTIYAQKAVVDLGNAFLKALNQKAASRPVALKKSTTQAELSELDDLRRIYEQATYRDRLSTPSQYQIDAAIEYQNHLAKLVKRVLTEEEVAAARPEKISGDTAKFYQDHAAKEMAALCVLTPSS